MATFSSFTEGASDFGSDLVAGVGEGDPLSLVVLGLLGLLFVKLFMKDWVWWAVRTATILGIAGVTVLKASIAISERPGYEDYGPIVLGVGAVLTFLILLYMVMSAVSAGRAAKARGFEDRPQRTQTTFEPLPEPVIEPHTVTMKPPVVKKAPMPPVGQRGGGAEFGYSAATPALDKLNIMDPRKDQNIPKVLTFMLVAEFGVVTSVTFAPKDPVVGAVFFALFMAGAAGYVVSTYQDRKKALGHFGVAVVAAVGVSLVLGPLWSTDPGSFATQLRVLLGVAYFTSSSMVAAVSGVAFSLLLGSK